MGALKSITHSYTANEYLFWYIEKNDIPNIEKLLTERPELVEKSLTVNFKTTPLHRAAVNGNLELAQLLIEKYHAQVDGKTPNGETPLIGAIKKNKIELVRYLLACNAKADIVSDSGLTPCDYAILAGFYQIALIVSEKMKELDIKEHDYYEMLGKRFLYRYVNYKVFLENLKLKVDEDNVPDFLTKQKVLYEDPVVDPRESWKNWFWRNLDFKDPPLCERSSLDESMQPQNRRFGKLRHFFSTMAMTHMTQKPSFQPHRETYSISQNKLHQKQLKENSDRQQIQSI